MHYLGGGHSTQTHISLISNLPEDGVKIESARQNKCWSSGEVTKNQRLNYFEP